MELRINLATASLKDAEHAIFLIGAYFGLTQATVSGITVAIPAQDVQVGNHSQDDPTHTHTPVGLVPTPPAAEPDPAAVFGGNGATAPAGPPATPTAAPSAQPAAAPAVGDAGNVAGTVAGPVGTPQALPPVVGASAPPGVELDADGLPWDGRINASGEAGGKPKNADGRWRKKRGLNDEAYIKGVQAELRATMAAPVPAVAPVIPTAPPAAPSLPAPPAVPSAPAAPVNFEQLMPRVTRAMVAGVIPGTALQQAAEAYGVAQVTQLANRPDLIPSVWAYLTASYPALQ